MNQPKEQSTAYGFKTWGPVKVSGRHLSLACNSPQFRRIEEEANAPVRKIIRGHLSGEDLQAAQASNKETT